MPDDIWPKALLAVGLGLIALGLGGFLIGPYSLGVGIFFSTIGTLNLFSALYGLTKAKVFKIGMYLSFLVWFFLFIQLFTPLTCSSLER